MKSRASDTLTVFLAVTTGEEAAGGSRMCSLLLNKTMDRSWHVSSDQDMV